MSGIFKKQNRKLQRPMEKKRGKREYRSLENLGNTALPLDFIQCDKDSIEGWLPGSFIDRPCVGVGEFSLLLHKQRQVERQ